MKFGVQPPVLQAPAAPPMTPGWYQAKTPNVVLLGRSLVVLVTAAVRLVSKATGTPAVSGSSGCVPQEMKRVASTISADVTLRYAGTLFIVILIGTHARGQAHMDKKGKDKDYSLFLGRSTETSPSALQSSTSASNFTSLMPRTILILYLLFPTKPPGKETLF